MVVSLLVSLYTSRVVLSALGFEDYGIYNVLGGLVAMFLFVNYALSTSTSRYFAFSLGEKDFTELNKCFNVSLLIHIGIALIILIGCESIGTWFMNHKMVIPSDRFNVARIVFHISIITALISVIIVPFSSLIIAYEKMDIFAYLTLSDTFFKFAIAFVIDNYIGDRLLLYTYLLLGISILNLIFYIAYCNCQFQTVRFCLVREISLYKSFTSFAAWSLVGNIANIGYTQGLNMLLNVFFGPIVNAARGIAVQVESVVKSFVSGFQTAINPQIIKSYASKEHNYLYRLIITSSKFSFFLYFTICLPIFIEVDTFLSLWLKDVPEYTSVFIRLLYLVLAIETISNSLMTSVVATGEIKKYQLIVGGILLSIVPIAYFGLKLGSPPQTVYIIYLIVDLLAFCARLKIVSRLIGLPKRLFCEKVILKCIVVSLTSIIMPVTLKCILSATTLHFCIITIATVISTLFSIYFFGVDKNEKEYFINKIKAFCCKRTLPRNGII